MKLVEAEHPANTKKTGPDGVEKKHVPRAGFLNSFIFAGQGIWYVIVTQRNMRIHFLAGILVIIAGVVLGISWTEWAALFTIMALVYATEMLNTVVEAIVDLVTREFHPLAKVAKDVAAGAVLLSAIFAVLVGIVIFLPHLINKFFGI